MPDFEAAARQRGFSSAEQARLVKAFLSSHAKTPADLAGRPDPLGLEASKLDPSVAESGPVSISEKEARLPRRLLAHAHEPASYQNPLTCAIFFAIAKAKRSFESGSAASAPALGEAFAALNAALPPLASALPPSSPPSPSASATRGFDSRSDYEAAKAFLRGHEDLSILGSSMAGLDPKLVEEDYARVELDRSVSFPRSLLSHIHERAILSNPLSLEIARAVIRDMGSRRFKPDPSVSQAPPPPPASSADALRKVGEALIAARAAQGASVEPAAALKEALAANGMSDLAKGIKPAKKLELARAPRPKA